MNEKFGQLRPNEVPKTGLEHAEKPAHDIEQLSAFDDDEYLDLVHRNTLYGETPVLTPKEFVHTLKHLGFKSFDDFYALDLNSKYEVLHDLGIADYNKPNFLLNSVLGFLNKYGGFERSNKTNFEKILDEDYATFISFYNRSKEEIKEEKAYEEFLQQFRKFAENVKTQEREMVMQEFMDKIPDIETMNVDEKIALFEALSDPERQLGAIVSNDNQVPNTEVLTKASLYSDTDLQSIKDGLKEEVREGLLRWDRGEFKEGQKSFDADFQSLRSGNEGQALDALGKDLVESYGSHVANELKSSIEINELLESLDEGNADSSSNLELNIMEGPQEVQKKFLEISAAFSKFLETVYRKNESSLPKWYMKRLGRRYWRQFVDGLCVDVRKFINKNL